MGVRTIGYKFTGDYRDLDSALDRMDARIRQSVTSANNASGAAGTAATRTSAAIRAGSEAAVRAGALVVQAEQRSTEAIQAHAAAVEATAQAAAAAADAQQRASAAQAAADASTGSGAENAAARTVAITETAAAQRAAAELSVAQAAEDAAARAVEAAQGSATREVQIQERSIRTMAGHEAAAYRENEARTRAAEQEAEERQQRRAEATAEVGQGLLAVGAATAAGLGIAVKAFADFDQAMSQVAAGTNATGAELDQLRGAAVALGAGTQFSATEAAEAITALGKAGISTQDILSGGLKGSLDLAAAGQLAVADAAEIGATALTQFGLKGSDLGHVADLLAAGAGEAQGEVTDLAGALKYVGPVAAGMGISIEETTGVLAEFAAQGIIGEQAGTGFRGMLTSLTSPSKAAAAEMKDLGLNLYDAKGNFVGVQGVAGQLQEALGGMSEEARNAALGVLFGNEQITAARVLYQGGAQAVEDWTDRVTDAGRASRVASQITDNLAGDMEKLKGAFSSAFIEGGAAGDGPLRKLVQTGTSAVDAFNGLPKELQHVAFGFAALTAAATLTGGSMLLLLPRIAATKIALIELTGSAAAARATVIGLSTALGAVAFLASSHEIGSWIGAAGVASTSTDKLAASLKGLAQTGNLSKDGLSLFTEGIGPFRDGVDTTEDALKRFGDSAHRALDEGWDGRVSRLISFGAATAEYQGRVKALDGSLADLVSHGSADDAAAAFKILTQAQVDAGVPLAVAQKSYPAYTAALAAAGKAAKDTSGKTGDLTGKMSDAATKAQKLAVAMKTAGDAAADAAKKAFENDTDVLGSYSPAEGDEKASKAAEALAKARQRVADVEERISDGRKGATVSEEQSLRRAREAVRVAEQAAKAAGSVDLGSAYRDTIQQATQFTKDVSSALKKGLDPRYVQELLEQGPKQAGPILREIVSDHSGKLIDIVNKSEKKIRALNRIVAEEARLTAAAVASGTDQLTGELSDAVRIATAKIRQGAKATSESIGKALKLPPGTVQAIASDFGIILDAQNALDPDKQLEVSTSGVSTAVGAFQEVKAAQDALKDKNVTVGTRGTARAKREVDDVLAAMDRLKNKSVTVKIRTDGPAGILNPNYGKRGQGLGVLVPADAMADGGPVTGPGGPRDDLIPTLLSNREWVQPASAVDYYGTEFMEAIRTRRLPRFADGGLVGSTTGLPAMAGLAAQLASSARATHPHTLPNQRPIVVQVPVHQSHSESHTRTAHVEHLHLAATNPREFEDWVADQARKAHRSYS